MRFFPILITLLAVGVITASGADGPKTLSGPGANAAAAKTVRAARAPAPTPGSLPGKGLAQHPFLYAGQWDTRNPVETMFLVRGGRVVWTHTIPDREEQAGRMETAEFSDIHLLSNGNVLYARKTGATEITQDKKVVWNYDAPKGTEVHSAQPVGLDKVFLCRNGTPAKALLVNKRTGKVEMEHELATKSPHDPGSVHGQFRHIRLTKAGTYLIPHMNLGKVVEYDKDWKEVWSIEAKSCWAAVRLTNGNTLISGNQNGCVREVNRTGETVWEINKDDLPGIPLYTVQECSRLANGNTVVCNWGGSIQKADWNKVVQIIEVTPDKKVVWALHQWDTPDLGPASLIQLLDEPGAAENGDLRR